MAASVSIEAAVGEKSPNKPVDVIRMQDLLNNNLRVTELKQLLPVNGTSDAALIDAIKAFQANHPGIRAKKPDGKISPAGNTLRRLEQCLKLPEYHSYMPAGFASNTIVRFNVEAFLDLYARQYPQPPLGAGGVVALHDLLDRVIADADVTDLRWAAYMLATVKHECANTWLPIEEYGKGKGKAYSAAVAVKIDAKTTVSNVYYGRGFVQLTWDHRYKAMDKALGYSGEASLYACPANALLPDVAYSIMSYGMRHGSFTGVGLGQYISGNKVNYLHARRVINGSDEDLRIKAYAVAIEFLLRFCNGVPLAQ